MIIWSGSTTLGSIVIFWHPEKHLPLAAGFGYDLLRISRYLGDIGEIMDN
jgi:hypothetical protein